MPDLKRLAIVATHPVQYHSPLFQLIAARKNIEIKVFYTWSQWQENKIDEGFGKIVEWDIPLLQGYKYEFVFNNSSKPGINNFRGINNPSLYKNITDWNANAVLVIGWNYQSHFNIMRKLKGSIPVFFRGDSHLLNHSPQYKKLMRKAWLSFVYHFIDKAFYVGHNNLFYYKAFGLKGDQLIFAPHAVDNKRFSTLRISEENHFRKLLALSDENIVFLFAGKFESNKDPFLLIRAFKSLNHDNARLIMVGNGALEIPLKKIATGDSRIQFLEFQNQGMMPSLYAAADVYVLPSISETWGLAINEAMASGKAIIASDKVGCVRDLVNEDYNGYVFPAGDENTLRLILERITQDKDKVVEMGLNSTKVIMEWSFEKIAIAIESELIE